MRAVRVHHLGRFPSTSAHLVMPDPDPLDRLPVHPHQLEVQEFDSYELIVDLRSAGDFGVDHVPGAISVPWTPAASLSIDVAQARLFAAEPTAPYLVEQRMRAL